MSDAPGRAPDPGPGWAVIVPVKLLASAKTRLSDFGPEGRADLALAFAGDVVSAALACPAVDAVLVVTDDERAAAALSGPGVTVCPDQPDAGLNPALEHGVDLLRAAVPGRPVVAVSSDLPALMPQDLTEALAQVRTRGFVADCRGDGTTLLAAAAGQPLGAAYGAGSAGRHRAGGAVALDAAPSLRRDVDTPQDLADALRLGVGPRTAAAVTRQTLFTWTRHDGGHDC